ncbi:MAG TPA: HypC/HybG/HupF family hydrogenase formation chaperone [Myxococcota bacterium]|nr:HypC/HybG/HupF family hydrogenase formation chaperone [Myxococcota bacterium]
MRLLEVQGELGKVELGGVLREVSLVMLPEARVGDHVLVHAGFAIEALSEAQAAETLALLGEVMAAGEAGGGDGGGGDGGHG